MILTWGEKMKSQYLQRVQFKEGVDLRLNILSVDKVLATQSHYIENQDYRGTYSCIGGVCCQAKGIPQQKYFLPVWVYLDPSRSYDGLLQALPLAPAQYEEFVKMDSMYRQAGYSITQIDFLATSKKQGRGVRTSYMAVAGQSLKSYMPPEFLEKVQESLGMFYQLGEQTLVKAMTHNDWMELLEKTGTPIPQQQALVLAQGYNPQLQNAQGIQYQVQASPNAQINQKNPPQQSPFPAPPAATSPTFPHSNPVQFPPQGNPFPPQGNPPMTLTFPQTSPVQMVSQQSPFPPQGNPFPPVPPQGSNEVAAQDVLSEEELNKMVQ